MSDSVVEAVNPYARILYWEVWNFMSIAHGKCEFDDQNIINLKGYNDSGKSAMLQALKILISNSTPTKQVSFIQDDKDYFRVLTTFEDGVQILRDKYINGQSLYEMYKDGICIFTTKSGNALSRVTEVPKPIADYLGLVTYDNICLNARACFEKQIGVQTTGSENYKMFNTVLKSEEIASAGAMLNNDKNSLSSDINAVDNELQSYKNLLGDNKNLTEEMIVYLKDHDSQLDSYLERESSLNSMVSVIDNIDSIIDIPAVSQVDNSRLIAIGNIVSVKNSLDTIVVTPDIPVVDTDRLNLITSISKLYTEESGVSVPPQVSEVNSTRLSNITAICNIVSQINDCDSIIKDADNRLSAVSEELTKLQVELSNKGVRMVKCPGCGQIFNPEGEHVH